MTVLVLPADERTRKTNPKPDVGTGVTDSTVDYYDSIADYFRNSRRAVLAIRDKGIPDEEIPAVLHVARNSPASPNQVIDARKAGKSWADIASQYKVNTRSDDFVTEANLHFLTAYHGRPSEEVKSLRSKGASWVDINQEFRRSGAATKRKTTQ
jgi:hypothetical protein